ncbi:MAG: GLPGLI family protein [Polaribacter sp.]|uniref:GLPGLI family protein n=1 Tax=Polaribacter sp. TaxID=1920175 RepID=UPI002F351A89
MKIKAFFLFITFFINLNISFSQTGIVTYKTGRTKINKTSRPEMARKITEEINRISQVLYYNNKMSFFKKEKNIPIYPFEAKAANILTKSHQKWYQFNNSNKTAAHNIEILNKKYIVDKSYKMKGWELNSEVQIIDGYTCFKATRKQFIPRANKDRILIAWYTPDIPVPYGPVGNGGLPGLILKLEISNGLIYLVDKIILNPKKMKKIPSIKKGKKINIREMVILMRDARKVTPD